MKRTILKQLMCAALCVAIVCSVIFSLNITAETANDDILTKEEKVYANATLEQDFADDHVLVVLSKELSELNKVPDKSLFSGISVSKIKDLTALPKHAERKAAAADVELLNADAFRQILLLELPIKSKENVLRTIERLEQVDGIVYAGPDYIASVASTTPNDAYFSNQWALEKIQAPAAWDITTGSASVYVGVIDTGVANHPDLNANLVAGWDFENDDNTPNNDNAGHGTHVAGIIAAVGNNQTGISGMGWSVKIVPLQVSNTVTGKHPASRCAAAIWYAIDNGIPILNYSHGGYAYNYVEKLSIASYQGLFICAAGNVQPSIETSPRNIDNDYFYPSSYNLDNVISVANTKQDDALFSTSYYGGNTVHLAAPGTNILSCYPSAKCVAGTHGSGHHANGYHYGTGTSMAAPFVAGVAALIKSIRPDLSPAQIKALILDNVDQVSALSGKCITGGRLNAYKAVRAATESQTFTGDVNGDGRADVILSRKVNGKRALTVYLGQANGSFSNPITTQSTRNFFHRDPAFVGDFNGDGYTDVVVHWADNSGWRQLLVYRSKGDGTFYEGVNLSSTRFHNPLQYPCSFFVADVNGDGKDDFVVHYRNASGYRCALVYKGKAASPYLTDAASNALTSTNLYRFNDPVYMGDFNGDGRADMVVHWNVNGKRQLLVYTAKADGTFNAGTNLASTRDYDPANYPAQYFIGDVNGDGKDDFIVHWSNASKYRTNYVYKGKNTSPYLTDATGNAMTSTNTYVGSDPVFIGDINGDGRDDMIVQWADSNKKRQILIYTGKADGTYNTGANYPTTNTQNPKLHAATFLIGDVNGDGRDDFIVKWRNTDGTVRFLTYRGTAGGAILAAVATVPTPSIPFFDN